MSETPRPSLKLTFSKKKAAEQPQSQPAPPPPEDQPPPLQRKLTLKIARKPTEEEPQVKQQKPKRPRISVKKKKRPADEAIPDEPSATGASQQAAGPKRLKLNPSKKPGLQSIRIKNKGLVPNRPTGVGYDSEASDTEIDPAIEEQFILRMLPGEDCEYLRRAITERRFDRSEFSFKPLTREGRRSVLKIRDKQYAATLVDLPCIVEGMKSWDRRGWYKSADICQMLLVLGPIATEAEAMDYPLPSEIQRLDDKTLQYPHGLAPPLRWVRKRRFRDRLSTRTIEQVERQVEDLIAQDEAAIGPPRFELVDKASLDRAEGLVQTGNYDEYEEYDDEQDAEGEIDEAMDEVDGMFEDFEDTLAAEMEAALAAGADGTALEAGVVEEAPDSAVYQAGTPIAAKPSTPPADVGADTSGDESEASNGEESTPEDELDDEQLEQQRQIQQHREEIAELEALIRSETTKWEAQKNQILKGKLAKRIHDLKQDLALKKVSIGEGDDAES